MCRALLGLSGTSQKREFSISITAAAVEKNAEIFPATFSFGVDSIHAIRKIIDHYADNFVVLGATIEGQVKTLDRIPGEENGNVTMATKFRNEDKNVVFAVTPDDFLDAIHASEQRLPIRCTGDLHVAQRSAKLLNPREFAVFRSGDIQPLS